MKVTQVGTREIRGMVLLGDVYAVLVGGFLKKTNTKFTYGYRGIEVVDGVWKIEDVVTNSNIASYFYKNAVDILNDCVPTSKHGFYKVELYGEAINNEISPKFIKFVKKYDKTKLIDEIKSCKHSTTFNVAVCDSDVVKNSNGIASSNIVTRSSAISGSQGVTNAKGVCNSKAISKSRAISHSRDVRHSFGVVNGYNVGDSDAIYVSNDVEGSRCVDLSNTVNNSYSIFSSDTVTNGECVSRSDNVVNSECVSKSYAVVDSKCIYNSRVIRECVGVDNSLFCYKKDAIKNNIFNKQVSSERIEDIKSELLRIWYNVGFLYENNNQLYMSIKIKEYIKSLPEFDEEVYNNVMGVK